MTAFNRIFAFLTAALVATLLVATVAVFAGVRVGGAPTPVTHPAPAVAETRTNQATSARLVARVATQDEG